ncbi:hypothetical protein BH10PSE18_BH10PSE18_12110 [soil metagenome]
MVNRYIGYQPPTSTSVVIGAGNPVGSGTQGFQDAASVVSRSPTPSIIDPEQFSSMSRSNTSITAAATSTAHRSVEFSAPSPAAGLSLHELASLHENLNEIAFTPEWRDNAPAAVAELRRRLPTPLPPTYELLDWGCDRFTAFIRSGSCSASGALMDILRALNTLIEDTRIQLQPSTQYWESTSPSPSKRPRLDNVATQSGGSAVQKSAAGDSAPSIKGVLAKLEQIPRNAQDWTDQAAPITKELIEVLESDQALSSRHPFLLTLCMVFDTCNNKVVGDDLVIALREAMHEDVQPDTGALADKPNTRPSEADAKKAPADAAIRSPDLVFTNVAENAIYGLLCDDPTMTNKEIHKRLPHWKPRAIRQDIVFVRAHVAFHLETDKFVRILECLARSPTALSFLNILPKVENMAISSDLFDDLQSALTEYRDAHDGEIPSNEAEVALFAKALKPSEPAAAIRLAATRGPSGCISRKQALSDWMAKDPNLAMHGIAPHPALQPAESGMHSGGRLTVKSAVLENPSAGNTTLHNRMPDLLLSTVRKSANAARDEIAFSLPSLEIVLKAIAIVDASATPVLFRVALGKNDLGMNVKAFPDWKIALDIYKQTHGDHIPASEKDVEELAKCVPVSVTASPVFWALTRMVDGYRQPIDIATADWKKREPAKFAPFKDFILPRSVWP